MIKKADVIIQARLTSTRLPKKVLAPILGEPMLLHVIKRVRAAKLVDRVILAIADNRDNSLEEFAIKNNIPYLKGSEDDVLSRYYKTAQKFNVKNIVRLCSDQPLIDPSIIDEIIKAYFESGVNYCSNLIKRTFPRGLEVEVFDFSVLKKSFLVAKEKYQREHVTPYIYENKNLFKTKNIEAKGELRRPDLRFTVDTKEDLEFIKKIHKLLHKNDRNYSVKEVIKLLDKRPDLVSINKNIKQKAIK